MFLIWLMNPYEMNDFETYDKPKLCPWNGWTEESSKQWF